ncbi:HAD hydrolase-like protein [Cellulomonas timonensis]|uniref:HAD hydrolase-like protein n=1 Tax=Cellulomonas timonensis TaxID=1689271 RepID=UPI0008378338|nr:HAD hydrolase-like protein [Cellulomonas timonensis]
MTDVPSPLVLLDLDGTLTDSAPGIVSSVAHAYRALGLPVPDPATLRSFVGPPITVSFLAHGIAPDRLTEAVAAYRAAFTAEGMFDNSLYPGILEAIARLRAAGCTLAVATSKPEVYARPICERFGITPLVDGVYGAPLDDVPSTKATVIAHALAELGPDRVPGPARTVMVGDREHDVLGAAEHGIDCLGVTWGYAQPGELLGAGAVDLVDDVASLAQAVLARVHASETRPV